MSHTIYSGKFNLDKLIFYHKKEAEMGNFLDDIPRYRFHCNAIDFLEDVRNAIDNKQPSIAKQRPTSTSNR